ncbi:MAG TPA: ABC transporter ATP-binding protein [Pseudomonadota bacterium]|jgi:lipoprotein-releasing system ATP-binding protein|nr:ABC transporter ATP-binding protein [Pseudomonadota bacterium]HND10961.1 ABC transporter ATP-binding protein [Pseudomonadota bacterium]HNK43583.1 ABC transporter ATP-binding protein [Pseudomonadota bacterium]HNN49591.1 ABC transporter ATP-binding protein [Pseudomonadota bacterium]HNO68017.1 ABC transporter ATP-binding protein [Pseudomonadota bacterium]
MSGAPVEIIALRKTFAFGGRPIEVLKGIDLTIDAGEMVAVVGASGAGKSTFLHVLGTLDVASSGKVIIDGADVTSMPPTVLANFRNHTIGFVFQFHHLLPEFSAVENAAMPGLIAGLDRRVAQSRAEELLKRVGLGHRLAHRPGELSGGEQQRVALARALVMQPRLLLADEPTGNLDARTGAAIHELVVELNRERGMTMIVVTHNEDLAARMPRRLHMADGRILTDEEAKRHATAVQEGVA